MVDALSDAARFFDPLPCGVLVLDRAGRVVHMNPRLCRMTRRPCEQTLGLPWRELFWHGDGHDPQIDPGSAWTGEPLDGEGYLAQPDGSRRAVVASSAPLGNVPPLSEYRVLTLADISKQKAAEEGARNQYKYIAEVSNTVLEQAMELKDYSVELERRVRERTAQLHDAQLDAIYMLAVASEAKDFDTGRHVRRIQQYSQAIAGKLGLPAGEVEAIGYAAILHDVGKFHVPDHILKKPGPLTDAERAEMMLHTIAGERIISDSPFFDRSRRIARSHHENWDGTGYPDRLAGEAIPVEARIVHLADVYDALVSSRVYKQPWTPERAAALIVGSSGSMFEPRVAEAFAALVEAGEFERIRSRWRDDAA
jgi:HD-GYP domain-containing protein (c-di-GMP phosphodiesterase class II)